jgi:TonB-dependent receptor
MRVIFFIFFIISVNHSFAQLSGYVLDANTNEPVFGAKVVIKELNLSKIVELDGKYHFHHLPVGTYSIVCIAFDYEKKDSVVVYNGKHQVVDFRLKLKSKTLNQVTIKYKSDVESDQYSQKREQNAESIINVVSSKSIQLLPDITTAGVLQRVSAVTLEKTSTGDARYVVIRGMDQRYNYTLVNNIKIPSPDNKYRFIPMDMFPAELLERLEVIKALTPAMEGDAIGGGMNLIMKNAPEERIIRANISGGYSAIFSDRPYYNYDKSTIQFNSPSDLNGNNYISTPSDFKYDNFNYQKNNIPTNYTASFTYGERFLKDKKFGVVLSASYQNIFSGSNSLWFRPENQPAPGNLPAFTDVYVRKYNAQNQRLGIHNKLDYVFNEKNKLSLYNLYMESSELQYRSTIDTSLSIGRSGKGTGNTYILFRDRYQKQTIYNSTLQGEHKLFNIIDLNWSGVYSKATNDVPDWSEYQTVHQVGFDINGNQFATPEVLNIPFYRIWTRNSDRDLAGYLDVNYKFKILSKNIEVKAGGLYRDKVRDNVYNEWNLVPKTSSIGQPVPFDGTLRADLFQFNGITAAQGSPKNPLNYKATEKILAYYGQLSIDITEKFSVLGGMRVEQTTQGWVTQMDPKISYGAYGTIPYTDYLKSIHFKYKINKEQNIRLSYFDAINRPGFFEYIPFTINDDNFTLSGNPNLKHATAKNYDLRYELFSKGLNQLLAGIFYKEITNPIEMGILFNGTSSATLKPNNFGLAKNFGAEFSFVKYFGEFGFSGNYTYTDSKITTSKLYYDTNFVASQVTQTRPLQGQSPHIANLSFLFKNQKIGLDIQLAGVYTGKKITLLSPYKDLDYWQKGMFQLDFSIEKKVFNYFSVYLKASNLLNTPILVQILQPNIYTTGKFALTNQTDLNRVTVQKEVYGQRILIGIRFNNKKKEKLNQNQDQK